MGLVSAANRGCFPPAYGVIYKSNLWIYGFRERSEREAYFPACGVIYKSKDFVSPPGEQEDMIRDL